MTAPLDAESHAAAPASAPQGRPPGFAYSPMYPLGADNTPYRKLDIAGVSTVEV